MSFLILNALCFTIWASGSVSLFIPGRKTAQNLRQPVEQFLPDSHGYAPTESHHGWAPYAGSGSQSSIDLDDALFNSLTTAHSDANSMKPYHQPFSMTRLRYEDEDLATDETQLPGGRVEGSDLEAIGTVENHSAPRGAGLQLHDNFDHSSEHGNLSKPKSWYPASLSGPPCLETGFQVSHPNQLLGSVYHPSQIRTYLSQHSPYDPDNPELDRESIPFHMGPHVKSPAHPPYNPDHPGYSTENYPERHLQKHLLPFQNKSGRHATQNSQDPGCTSLQHLACLAKALCPPESKPHPPYNPEEPFYSPDVKASF